MGSRWELFLTPTAEKEIAKLPRRDREAIVSALDRLTSDPASVDLRKLGGSRDEWRMRVGVWRVRFRFKPATNAIEVLHVLRRSVAYRR